LEGEGGGAGAVKVWLECACFPHEAEDGEGAEAFACEGDRDVEDVCGIVFHEAKVAGVGFGNAAVDCSRLGDRELFGEGGEFGCGDKEGVVANHEGLLAGTAFVYLAEAVNEGLVGVFVLDLCEEVEADAKVLVEFEIFGFVRGGDGGGARGAKEVRVVGLLHDCGERGRDRAFEFVVPCKAMEGGFDGSPEGAEEAHATLAEFAAAFGKDGEVSEVVDVSLREAD
jgi:hypothetical protein